MQKMQLWQEYRSFSTQRHERGSGGTGETGEIRKAEGITGGRNGREAWQEVASVFYADVLRAYANLSGVLRFWAICNLVLRQAREQLDPQRQGIAVTIARCLPPCDGKKIRSLHECMRIATWEQQQEDTLLFLGAESLAGYAVSMGRPAVIQNLSQGGQRACRLTGNGQACEQSMAAYPIIRAGKIAGCLTAASMQPDYFAEAERLQLLQRYADEIMLSIDPEKFSPGDQIDQGVTPAENIQ